MSLYYRFGRRNMTTTGQARHKNTERMTTLASEHQMTRIWNWRNSGRF